MVGAFPEARLVVGAVDRRVLAAPVPLPSLMVDDVVARVCPRLHRPVEHPRLVVVEEEVRLADDVLRLHPPVAVAVEMAVAIRFVDHRTVGKTTLESGMGDAARHSQRLREQALVAKHLCCLEQEPRRLDVVTVGDDVVGARPVVEEEESEMASLARRDDAVDEESLERLRSLEQVGVAPHAKQVGVRLDDVQVGVHRLRHVGVLGAQAHVLQRVPEAVQSLGVATVNAVAAVRLDVAEKAHGIVQRLGVARSPRILAESIDGKAQRIELLLGVERSAVGCYRPEHASVLMVVEAVDDLALGACSHLQVRLVAQHAVGGREGPEDARIEDGSLGSVGVQLVVSVATAMEAAARIHHVFDPIWQYVAGQALPHLTDELLLCHKALD